MQAKIEIWGKAYFIKNISWGSKGNISFVGFEDEEENFYTIFHGSIENVGSMKGNTDELLQADLEERLKWVESLVL